MAATQPAVAVAGAIGRVSAARYVFASAATVDSGWWRALTLVIVREDLLDRALYVAKDQGRDRLAMSAPVLTLFPEASGA